MPLFRLHHHHTPDECRIVFASWQGIASPLRHRATLASCVTGGHEIWWDVEAESEPAALDQLPGYVAERTDVIAVTEIEIP
jgi:hypothetical protein